MKRYSYKQPNQIDEETPVIHMGDFERGELALLAGYRISNSELFQGFIEENQGREFFGSKMEPSDGENL